MSLAEVGSHSDPEWQVEDVEWDPVGLTAAPAVAGGGKRPVARRLTQRAINTSCQVEGCPRQLLPLRSYYQRQHICEEHFRALAITDASGRIARFCQQCTKLEPLDNFDGERRSCRMSLERRNTRRLGKRSSGQGQRAKRAASAAAPPPMPGSHSGSGSGSTTAGPLLASPSLTTSSVEPPPGREDAARLARTAVAAPPGAGAAAGAAPWPQDASLAAAAAPVAAGPVSGYWLSAGPAAAVNGAAADHAFAAGGGAAGVRLWPMGELDYLAPADVDDLLSMDPDNLAAALLDGGVSLPADGLRSGGSSAAASDTYQASPQMQPPAHTANVWQLVAPRPAEWFQPAQQPAAYAAHTTAARQPAAAAYAMPPPAAWEQPAAAWQAEARAAPQPAVPPLRAATVPRIGQQLIPVGLHQASMGPRQQAALAQQQHQAALAQQQQQQGWAMQQQAALAQYGSMQLPGAATALMRDADIQDLLVDLMAVPPVEEIRVSLKLYGVHPEHLPADLRAELLVALQLRSTHLQTSLRTGCVHLTLAALASDEEATGLRGPGAAAAVAARLAPMAARLLPSAGRLVVQAGGSAALLALRGDGTPALLLSVPLAPAPAVQLSGLAATTVGAAGGRFRLRVPRSLLLGGRLGLHCRVAGRHVPLALSLVGGEVPQPPCDDDEVEPAEGGASDSEDAATDSEEQEGQAAAVDGGASELVDVQAWVPAAAGEADGVVAAATGGWQRGWGLYEFEASSGALLSQAVPVLVLPDSEAAAAAELARMPPGPQAATALRLAGAVLRYLEAREAAAGGAAPAFEAAYPPLAVSRLAEAARTLLQAAERCGWAALAGLLEPAAIADGWHPARAALAQPGEGSAASEEGEAAPAEDPRSVSRSTSGASSSGSGRLSPTAAKAAVRAAGAGGEAGLVPELDQRDCLRRVMPPAVLGAVTLVVAGVVLGVGAALMSGHLG